MTVLIVTMPHDADAQVTQMAITEFGVECELFYPADFAGGAEWSFDPSESTFEVRFRESRASIALKRFHSIWMRRPVTRVPREYLVDMRERAAAESEASCFVSSMLSNLEHGRFVANRLNSTRLSQEKPYQFRLAQSAGMELPRTLVSNSPERILEFFNALGKKIIYKTLVPMLWSQSSGLRTVGTTIIDNEELLKQSDLVSAPGIYQECISKRAEVRVTILGRTALAYEKTFPTRASDELDVDWRCMHRGAKYVPHELPQGLLDKCYVLLKSLGLVMGVFDFALDQNGNYIFLEVNPQGQFLWGDQVCEELNHLEALAEFLIAGDSSFQYRKLNRVRLSQFNQRSVFERLEARERKEHFSDLTSFRYSSVTLPLGTPLQLPEDATSTWCEKRPPGENPATIANT